MEKLAKNAEKNAEKEAKKWEGNYDTLHEHKAYIVCEADVIRCKPFVDGFGKQRFKIAAELTEAVRTKDGEWQLQQQLHTFESYVDVPVGQQTLIRQFGSKQSKNSDNGKVGKIRQLDEIVGVIPKSKK